MPTGYTAKLMESGQSFPEFVLQCARNFGACIMMRDDPMDAPIPERFDPDPYYKTRVTHTKRLLAKLKGMSRPEKVTYGRKLKAEEIKSRNEWLAKEMKENARLTEMLAKVEAWAPPSEEHLGLKFFMQEQIKISTNDLSYVEKDIACARSKCPKQFYLDALNAAERDAQYAMEELEKEKERAASRSNWIQLLRKSIGSHA